MFRRMTALAFAASMAPFVFFGLVILTAFGLTALTFGPSLLTFIGWMTLSRWARRAARETPREEVIEARIVREKAVEYPPEAYSPPAHFDLLLSAKHDIGRIRGAAQAMADGALARQFQTLAAEADAILSRLMAEPVKLGLARRYFSSYLPRAADLADSYHRLKSQDESRRNKLLDVLYRLEAAMKQQLTDLSAPEMARLDADIRILGEDLKAFTPNGTKGQEPILSRIEEVVETARRKR